MFSLGVAISTVDQVVHGSGKHFTDIDFTQFVAIGRTGWWSILFYALTLAMTKLSICLIYLTIFTFEWSRRACWLLIAIVTISSLFTVISIFTACIPLQAFWDFRVKARYCHKVDVYWANTGMHLGTDYLIFALPIPVLYRLNLPRRQKMALFAVFALGFLVCAISVFRLIDLIQTTAKPDIDFSYNAATLNYWTNIEVNGAIVCACVTTLRPLVARIFPQLLGSLNSGAPRRPSASEAAVGAKTEDDPYEWSRAGGGGSGSRPTGTPLRPPTIGSRPIKVQKGGTSGRNESWIDFPGKIGGGKTEVEFQNVSWFKDLEFGGSKGIGLGIDVKERPSSPLTADIKIAPPPAYEPTPKTASPVAASKPMVTHLLFPIPPSSRGNAAPTSRQASPPRTNNDNDKTPHKRQPSAAKTDVMKPLPTLPPDWYRSSALPQNMRKAATTTGKFYDPSSSQAAASGPDLLEMLREPIPAPPPSVQASPKTPTTVVVRYQPTQQVHTQSGALARAQLVQITHHHDAQHGRKFSTTSSVYPDEESANRGPRDTRATPLQLPPIQGLGGNSARLYLDDNEAQPVTGLRPAVPRESRISAATAGRWVWEERRGK